jgi:hypothetical protein
MRLDLERCLFGCKPLQDFLQVLSIFASFNFEWPPALVALYNAFSLASFNLELLAPECRWEYNIVAPQH